jgi:hypothetical protein
MTIKDVVIFIPVRSGSSESDGKASDGGLTPIEYELEPLDDIDPKEERAFVWRIDLWFLTIGFFGYAFKYLDQTNISHAHVSGMKEDLNLYGNQLNFFTTCFNIGYMVMLYPSCIIISHIGPAKWLPACEVMWGVFTCCLSTVTNARQVCGLRFLVGFFEGCAWPGYFTLISQWYLPHEMALCMSLFNIAQPVGAMLSGALQGALSTNLDGTLGRSGWRWAFIIAVTQNAHRQPGHLHRSVRLFHSAWFPRSPEPALEIPPQGPTYPDRCSACSPSWAKNLKLALHQNAFCAASLSGSCEPLPDHGRLVATPRRQTTSTYGSSI